jgi:uncharacterized membrane protein
MSTINETSGPGISWDPKEDLQTRRLETLSDGIFAIVMTILVFDLKLPEVPADQLLSALIHLWPNFLGYAVSFSLLGVYWLGHLSQFRFIRKTDHSYIWITILFFALVALVPFSTASLSRYPSSIITLALYTGNLTLIGIALWLPWRYATHNRRLVDMDLPESIVVYGTLRCLIAPAGYLVAFCFSFISPLLTLVFFIAIPLLYIIPGFHPIWMVLATRLAGAGSSLRART